MHLPQLDLLPSLRGREDARVQDTSNGEGPANNGTDRGDEPIQRLPPLCVLDCDGAEVIAEPDSGDDTACVAVGDILLVGHCVLVGEALAAAHVLINCRHDLQDIVVGGEGVGGESVCSPKSIESAVDVLDLQRVPKRELVDDVGHVWILGLSCGAVRGHVEVARNLIDAELALEAAASPAVEWDLHGVVDMAHLVPTHLILDVQPHQLAVQIGQTDIEGDVNLAPAVLVWVIDVQLVDNFSRDEPSEFRQEEEEDEEAAADGD